MRTSGLACFLLVALRLVIGWNFLVEGYYKIRSHQIGKTSTNKPWTSEPFFRAAYGTFGDWYREHLGVSDESALARVRVQADPKWDDYVDRFERHYELTAEQRTAVRAKLEEQKRLLSAWLKGESPTNVSKPVAWGTAQVQLTVPARIAEYEKMKRQIREIHDSEQRAFNDDVAAERLWKLMAGTSGIVNGLIVDLNSRTAEMKEALTDAADLTDAQLAKGSLPKPASPSRWIDRLDTVTMWMQAVLGGFLLIGLFTRLSSLILAGFLLQVILLMPASPSAPVPPGEMGHYLYVDMHVIEMVALLVLAAIPTGKWFGLDALFGQRGAKSI